MRLLKTIVAALLLIVMAVSMSGCSLLSEADSRPVCNLNDYVVISEEGKNGVGCVYMSVNYEAVLKDFGQYIDYEAADAIPEWLEYGVGTDIDAAIDALFNGVPLNETLRTKTFNLVISQETGLSNGDVVSVKWTDSPLKRDVLSKLLPIKFVYEDFTYTMSKLQTN